MARQNILFVSSSDGFIFLYFHGPSLFSISGSDPDATKVGGLPLFVTLVGQYFFILRSLISLSVRWYLRYRTISVHRNPSILNSVCMRVSSITLEHSCISRDG